MKLNCREICCVNSDQQSQPKAPNSRAFINWKALATTCALIKLHLLSAPRLACRWSSLKSFFHCPQNCWKTFAGNYKCVTLKTPILGLCKHKQRSGAFFLITPATTRTKRESGKNVLRKSAVEEFESDEWGNNFRLDCVCRAHIDMTWAELLEESSNLPTTILRVRTPEGFSSI